MCGICNCMHSSLSEVPSRNHIFCENLPIFAQWEQDSLFPLYLLKLVNH